MEINIVKIGNSQGIRIPKSVLKQVGLEKKARMVIEDGAIKIIPEDELTAKELSLMSEPSLAKLWNDSREDEAWKNL
jgi:antitoxin component of MazEF toxin-antitoxin module